MMTTPSNGGECAVPSDSAPRQIFLVDDNAGFRNSTRWLLESQGFQVDAFGDPRHFLAYLDSWPDAEPCGCVLLDIRMPELSGLEVQAALHERGSSLPIVFISGHGDVPMAVEAMRKGAAHFLEKPFGNEALLQALADAFARHQSPLRKSADLDPQATERLAKLTPRERQVFDLVIEGLLNKTIADRLGISIKTVELHRARVMHKMKARSIAQLVQLAMRAR